MCIHLSPVAYMCVCVVPVQYFIYIADPTNVTNDCDGFPHHSSSLSPTVLRTCHFPFVSPSLPINWSTVLTEAKVQGTTGEHARPTRDPRVPESSWLPSGKGEFGVELGMFTYVCTYVNLSAHSQEVKSLHSILNCSSFSSYSVLSLLSTPPFSLISPGLLDVASLL